MGHAAWSGWINSIKDEICEEVRGKTCMNYVPHGEE